jgi:hypothetical protein
VDYIPVSTTQRVLVSLNRCVGAFEAELYIYALKEEGELGMMVTPMKLVIQANCAILLKSLEANERD